jgi:NAD(P)-dependent dehydrogenase (short-subunit alcohol dehydrogenase family)
MKLLAKNALITGGSQGFGRHIVEAFLEEGANVIFCARTEADVDQTRTDLVKKLRPDQQLIALVADVSNPAHVADLFSQTARLGALHIVVNNAGIYGPMGPSELIDLSDWTQTWQVNVTGTLLVCQHAVRAMKYLGSGKIINISGGGATSPMPRFAAYAATKAAVVRLTETLAEEYRSDRIDINAVAPGAMATRLIGQVVAAGAETVGAECFEKNKKWLEDGGVDPRLGASLCVYLASNESDGLTGKLISAPWDPWRDPAILRALATGDVYTLRRIAPEDRAKLANR